MKNYLLAIKEMEKYFGKGEKFAYSYYLAGYKTVTPNSGLSFQVREMNIRLEKERKELRIYFKNSQEKIKAFERLKTPHLYIVSNDNYIVMQTKYQKDIKLLINQIRG